MVKSAFELLEIVGSSKMPCSAESVSNGCQMTTIDEPILPFSLSEWISACSSLRPSLSVREKGIQVSSTPVTMALPDVSVKSDNRKTDKQSTRTKTPKEKPSERIQSPDSGEITSAVNDLDNTRLSRRYLSQTWRVINPRDDMETNVRPENNSSSFFNYTKKVYPEYFFIHPDWY